MNEQNTLYGATVEQNILPNDLIKVYTYSIRKTLVCIGFLDFFIQLLNGFSIIQTNDKSIPKLKNPLGVAKSPSFFKDLEPDLPILHFNL